MRPTPFEIVWSPLALARLQEIRAYVALDKPDAAERLAIRIVTLVEALRTNPHLGSARLATPAVSSKSSPAIRELVVGGTPYQVLYHLHRRRIIITTIWHSAQSK